MLGCQLTGREGRPADSTPIRDCWSCWGLRYAWFWSLTVILLLLGPVDALGLLLALLGFDILIAVPARCPPELLDSLLEASVMAICVAQSSKKTLLGFVVGRYPGEYPALRDCILLFGVGVVDESTTGDEVTKS